MPYQIDSSEVPFCYLDLTLSGKAYKVSSDDFRGDGSVGLKITIGYTRVMLTIDKKDIANFVREIDYELRQYDPNWQDYAEKQSAEMEQKLQSDH